MSLDWVARQMEAYSLQVKQPTVRYNPRPAGVIQPGSASEAVLQILSASPGRFFTCEQLIRATGRTHAAVSFALLYLRDQGRIEAFPDAARNPRFLRYRIRDLKPENKRMRIKCEACETHQATPVMKAVHGNDILEIRS